MTVVHCYLEGVEALPHDAVGDLELINRRARPLEVGVETRFGYVQLTIRTARNRDHSIYLEPQNARTLALALLQAADDEIESYRRLGL